MNHNFGAVSNSQFFLIFLSFYSYANPCCLIMAASLMDGHWNRVTSYFCLKALSQEMLPSQKRALDLPCTTLRCSGSRFSAFVSSDSFKFYLQFEYLQFSTLLFCMPYFFQSWLKIFFRKIIKVSDCLDI